ncbi:DNA-binding protein [Staphylococcus casei]|uniref:DNA-binding protein n=1 Tax=Staphylococcus TaxID=1279 RepID=UPI000CD03D5E|nr:DNA-binding protein [Staphylococcus casei]PNZ60190.1 DNA-binding protein [Staphylococcus casei]PTI73475.1 DNA-binding protein [Staphylococcus succinus]WJE86886.1 DNA-binding protein [Staphylococcus casei]
MTTDLPKIGMPATHALKELGVTNLEEVASYERTTLLDIHGIGPKAIEILEQALKDVDLSFKNDVLPALPFKLTGDLNCDNAPKRRLMLEFLIGCALVEKEKLIKTVTENFIWNVVGAFQIQGLDAFYEELEAHQVEIASLNVTQNISHGKLGALHGTQIAKDGSTIYFADFFEFESHQKDAKVKAITSYVIMDEGDV